MKNLSFEPFSAYLEELSYTKSRFDVFDDFLTMMVCSLSMGRKEEEYLRTVKGYTKKELDIFCKAFASVIMQMEYRQLEDPFGDYFEEHLSNGRNGQFFTPIPVCELMANIVHGFNKASEQDAQKTVSDPACGSGRLLLASAKIDRNRYFVGSDISETCCKMTLINMCLNSIEGEVHHMDTLSLQTWRKWMVIIDKFTRIPYIYEVKKESQVLRLCKEDSIMDANIVNDENKTIQRVKQTSNGFIRFTPKVP
ncbi:MAG: N-6 DNA methylase [Bacteroides sp.]|uniref:N-6 DNA methylase n=1 Tax=Bacteroides sp. TaxID=29523 RepID=UPI002FCC0EDB